MCKILFCVFSREPLLYKRVCPSVGWSVGWSVGRSVTLSSADSNMTAIVVYTNLFTHIITQDYWFVLLFILLRLSQSFVFIFLNASSKILLSFPISHCCTSCLYPRAIYGVVSVVTVVRLMD